MATLGKNQMISSSQVQAAAASGSGPHGESSHEYSSNNHSHKRLRDESSSNNLNSSYPPEPLGTEMGYLDNNREEEDEDYYDE